MQQNQERIKSLEESIEAERAAHLETKFNSEIIQVIITLYMICSLYQWWARMLQWLGHLHFVVIVFSSVLSLFQGFFSGSPGFPYPHEQETTKWYEDIEATSMKYLCYTINPSLTKLVRLRWLDISLVFLSLRSIKTRKKKKNSVNTQSYWPHAWAKTHIWWCVWFVFSNWMYSVNV